MKLLTNKDYETIFVYFPGIDFPNLWTLENPAVYHKVKSKDKEEVRLSKFVLLSDEKYLLFKAQGGIKYQICGDSSSSSYSYYNDSIKVYLYDYLNFSYDDAKKNKNFIKEFELPQSFNDKVFFSFNYSKYILMKIMPNDERATSPTSIEKNFLLKFNNRMLEFDYSTHWIRDWTNRIDGTTWNVNGKLNSSNSLYCLNKNVGRSFY